MPIQIKSLSRRFGGLPLRDYTVRGQSNVWRLPKYWPPPPPHRQGECVPSTLGAGGGHTRWLERGWGVNSSEDARHCSVLYICKYFVGSTYYFAIGAKSKDTTKFRKFAIFSIIWCSKCNIPNSLSKSDLHVSLRPGRSVWANFSPKAASAAAGWPSAGRTRYFSLPHHLKEAKITLKAHTYILMSSSLSAPTPSRTCLFFGHCTYGTENGSDWKNDKKRSLPDQWPTFCLTVKILFFLIELRKLLFIKDTTLKNYGILQYAHHGGTRRPKRIEY